jgi:hypothetical protein
MVTYTKLHTSSYYSAEDVCISRLVEFELLLELKFEQNNGTSLDSPCYKYASKGKQSVHGPDVCPSQLYIMDNALGFTWTSSTVERASDYNLSLVRYADNAGVLAIASAGATELDNLNAGVLQCHIIHWKVGNW